MKSQLFSQPHKAAAFTVTFILLALGTRAAAPKPPAASSETNSVAAAPVVEIPRSIFLLPANPKEGRNPFFPQSSSVIPAAPVRNSNFDAQAFVLNGITSPPKRSAMINNYTFEAGESHEVRLPNGTKVLVKCEEIRDDSAVILVGGVRRELRLRLGL